MATSPSLTINSISNAVITDTNESVSMGKISWSVAAQADSALNATYYNYQNYANWDNRYSWTSTSGTTSFNGLSSTVTIHTQVSFTEKTIVATKTTPAKGMYQSLSDAQSAYSNAGDNTYYYSYEYVEGWYYVYQYNLTIESSTYGRDVTYTIDDVSDYVTIQETTETPSVTHFSVYPSSMTLEVGKTGTVSYLIDVEPPNSNPSYTITSSSSDSSIASCSNNVITANSIGTATITFECAGFTDTCVVTVVEATEPEPEVYVTDIYFNANKYKLTVDGESCDCTYTLSLSETVDAREFTVSVENLNDSVIQIDKHVRDYYGGTITITPLSAGISSLIISSGGYEDSCDIIVEEAAFPMFEWDTYITRGMSMNTYNKRPAPVKASEWNRLVDLVNTKCNTSIPPVSSGDSMIASSGGNVRQVADALGVDVDSGYTITAQFFLDLRDAVNAIKNNEV